MNLPEEFTHTTIYKTCNLEIESQKIVLDAKAWIETSSHYAGYPPDSLPVVMGHVLHPTAPYYHCLVDSKIILGSSHTNTEMVSNPFGIHSTDHIAIALSILLKHWIVVGIGTHTNSKNPDEIITLPWTTYFWGIQSSPSVLLKSDEKILGEIYMFVRSVFCLSIRDNPRRKFLFLYIRTIVGEKDQSVTALTTMIPSLFAGLAGVVINAAIFFEHVFTKESWKYNKGIKGVEIWNIHFRAIQEIDFSEVNLIMNFRHDAIHDDAPDANARINKWKQSKGYSENDDRIYTEIKVIATRISKNIARAAILNYEIYLQFRLDIK